MFKSKIAASLQGCTIREAAEDPGTVIALPKSSYCVTESVDVVEALNPQLLFFEGPEETFNAADALGLSSEGRRGLDAQEADLVLEVIAHIYAAVVMPEPQASGAAAGRIAEMLAHALADGLERLEAVRTLDHVDADALGGAVVDSGVNRDLSVGVRHRDGRVGAPQLIRPVGHDGSLVRIGGSGNRRSTRRRQMVLPHEPQYALLPHAHLLVAQPGPDLAIAFPRELGLGDELAYFAGQCLVGKPARTTLTWHGCACRALLGGIEARASQAPRLDHARHSVRSLAGGRGDTAHGFDLQNAKGRLLSSRVIFSRSSSFSMLTLATTDFSRRFSSSTTTTTRLFRLASPPARNRSRHSDRVAIVTPS